LIFVANSNVNWTSVTVLLHSEIYRWRYIFH